MHRHFCVCFSTLRGGEEYRLNFIFFFRTGIVQYVSIDDRGKEVKEAVVFSTLEQGSPGRAEIPVILQLGEHCSPGMFSEG